MTAPVGASGAVLLLPVHLGIFGVPNPAINPTTCCSTSSPGRGPVALRYRHDGAVHGDLAHRLVVSTLPAVVLGAAIRVFALPGADVFRLLIAAPLLPLGLWPCLRALTPAHDQQPPAGVGPDALSLVSPWRSKWAAASTTSAAVPSSARSSPDADYPSHAANWLQSLELHDQPVMRTRRRSRRGRESACEFRVPSVQDSANSRASDRAMSKVRNGERGHGGVERRLVALGGGPSPGRARPDAAV